MKGVAPSAEAAAAFTEHALLSGALEDCSLHAREAYSMQEARAFMPSLD